MESHATSGSTTALINLKGKLKKKDGFRLPDGVVYVGRMVRPLGLEESEWHNPFKEGKDGTREGVIEKYERYLLEDRPDLVERLAELRGKVLACWCAPAPCHGDVLARLAEGL